MSGHRTVYTIQDLLRVMQRLRDPETGCPWDQDQDFSTIVPSTLEECYELAEAIEQGDYPHVGEELGDVLFQVVFYAQLGCEQGFFSFTEIVDTLVEKLVRRHPHVFANGDIEGIVDEHPTVESVKDSWESIKQFEREARAQGGALADVPLALPALPRAQKLQKRAARHNFDWPDVDDVLAKVEEETKELRQAIREGDSKQIEAELGDVLFTCVNLCRHLGVDAEQALRGASRRFEGRFNDMESSALSRGISLQSLTASELDELWEAAKRRHS